MSYQQNQKQCQPPPKCQTPKCPPKCPSQASYTPPVSSGCGSSSAGCGSLGSGSGCSLFSHHRRSHGCRGLSPGRCGNGSGYNQQSGDCGGSSGGCGGGSGGCC